MRKVVHFIVVILLTIVLSSVLPWWSVMLAGCIAGIVLPLKKSAVFWVPFLAIALLWIVQAYLQSSTNDFVLAKKIAVLLPLGGNPYLLMLVTGLVGGIAAGVSGVFGKQCRLVLN